MRGWGRPVPRGGVTRSIHHRLEWRYARLVFRKAQIRLSRVRAWPEPYEAWWCDELFAEQRGRAPFRREGKAL